MRIGIYNRWLDTLGGGERYSLTMAAALAEKHANEVEYIAPTIPSPEKIERRLGLDLSRVKFVLSPPLVADLSKASQSYDIFINASQNSRVSARADFNVMLVFFPTRFSQSPLLRSLYKFLLLDVWLDGGSLMDSRSWLLENSGVVTITTPTYADQLPVRLFVRTAKENTSWLHVGDKRIKVTSSGTNVICHAPISAGNATMRLKVSSPIIVESIHIPKWQRRLISLVSRVPWIAERVIHNSPLPVGHLREEMGLGTMESYDDFWTISQYSQEWLWRWWRRHSKVLYPPVSVDEFHQGNKQKWILSVGRFFAGSHNKKQIEMIETFSQLIQKGLEGWELHLVGGTSDKPKHKEYFDKVREAAQGLPVVLHPNMPFADLKQLYAHSTIYWHATGLDEDKRLSPERFEHFGIVIVEAMAAGAIPIVFNYGGPTEIVRHQHSGLLWNNRTEWTQQTLWLVNDVKACERLSSNAVARSKAFSETAFSNRLNDLVSVRE
jgi:glycosyltransferase involved in cell wall biosynthesis